MHLDLTADELLTTTRSVRKRLDFDRPVARDVLLECLEIALQAPTGSNSQGWQWLFVEDADRKRQIADIYRANFAIYRQLGRPEYDPADARAQRLDYVIDSAAYLAEHLERAPVFMIPCLKGAPNMDSGMGASFWGSILPAAWSYMLALRERGLGSAWTTLHLILGGDAKVAEIVGIPHDQYTQAGLFPIAYTIGTEFKPAVRLPADQLVHWDQW